MGPAANDLSARLRLLIYCFQGSQVAAEHCGDVGPCCVCTIECRYAAVGGYFDISKSALWEMFSGMRVKTKRTCFMNSSNGDVGSQASACRVKLCTVSRE